jgi:hypothetical protein
MQNFVSVANTDDLLESLKNDHVTAERRAASMKRLIHEEDKLSRELEQLELAFSRLKRGGENVLRVRRLRDRFTLGSEAREQAERLLMTATGTQRLLAAACENLRRRHLQNGLIALPMKLERWSDSEMQAAPLDWGNTESENSQ